MFSYMLSDVSVIFTDALAGLLCCAGSTVADVALDSTPTKAEQLATTIQSSTVMMAEKVVHPYNDRD